MLQAGMEEKATPGATGGCKQTESQETATCWRIPTKNTQEPDQECLKLIRTKSGEQTAGYNVGLDVGNKPTEAPAM